MVLIKGITSKIIPSVVYFCNYCALNVLKPSWIEKRSNLHFPIEFFTTKACVCVYCRLCKLSVKLIYSKQNLISKVSQSQSIFNQKYMANIAKKNNNRQSVRRRLFSLFRNIQTKFLFAIMCFISEVYSLCGFERKFIARSGISSFLCLIWWLLAFLRALTFQCRNR